MSKITRKIKFTACFFHEITYNSLFTITIHAKMIEQTKNFTKTRKYTQTHTNYFLSRNVSKCLKCM